MIVRGETFETDLKRNSKATGNTKGLHTKDKQYLYFCLQIRKAKNLWIFLKSAYPGVTARLSDCPCRAAHRLATLKGEQTKSNRYIE